MTFVNYFANKMNFLKKINFIKFEWLIFYTLIFSFLLLNSFSYLDADFGWHLKVGEQIFNEKAIPSLEYYDYTLKGERWVDHEWLTNLLVFLIYTKFGYIALSVVFAILITFTIFVLNKFIIKNFLKNNEHFILIGLVEILGILGSHGFFGVRMQEITVLFLLLLLILIHNYSKNKNIRNLFFFIPLFYIWALLHAGFLIGFFVAFYWIGVKILEKKLSTIKKLSFITFDNKTTYKEISIFFSFTLISIIGTFFTPYGLKLYSFLSGYTNTYYLKNIVEWLPIHYFPINYYSLFYISLIITSFGIYFYNCHFSKIKVKINIWQVSLILLFTVLALKSKRHFPLLFISSAPYLILIISKILYLKDFKHNIYTNIIKYILVLTYIPISIFFLLGTNFIKNPFTFFCNSYPCEAVKYLQENEQHFNKNIYNTYGWGGYMIWAYPEKKLFIDGRLPQYKFAGHTMLEEYNSFYKEDANHNEKLNQYNIRLVLLIKEKDIKFNLFEKFFLMMNENKINDNENHLVNFLEENNEWAIVFENNNSIIYAKD